MKTSLHREVALERNKALRRWVLETAAHNTTSLRQRWVGLAVLASKTHALGRKLQRRREQLAARRLFCGLVLLTAKVRRWPDAVCAPSAGCRACLIHAWNNKCPYKVYA